MSEIKSKEFMHTKKNTFFTIILTGFMLICTTLALITEGKARAESTTETSTRQLAQASRCMSCHGPGGISQYSQWPNLAGQKAPYLITQLEAFRSGERKNGMMENVTKELTDVDIKQLAQYFSELPSENK
ncbi:c-type cytochrome [Serratia ureilytica]|uniref:c-type cytochrome n=1 Tax=Serratia ureilytica TaxID=300181 RepID=UPI0039B54899